MLTDEIREELFRLQDPEYRDFQRRLIPTMSTDRMIGVRTPELRKFAKELGNRPDKDEFLEDLPHRYYDEDQLHAFLLSEMKDYGECFAAVERFLPFVNNWATCDQMSPRVFRKHRTELLKPIRDWLVSEQPYTVRFGVGMLMEHYLDGDFDLAYPEMVARLRSDEYYVNMMIAWYCATALAIQYDAVLPFLEEQRLDDWTHNKAIQKAIESRRITPEQKAYLRGLKIKRQK